LAAPLIIQVLLITSILSGSTVYNMEIKSKSFTFSWS